MNKPEVVVFILYLLCMLAIGVFFFFKSRHGGEKTFFLSDRKMGAWVGALSAGASDMSAWVLMGLPTSVYAFGLGKVWIPVGLVIAANPNSGSIMNLVENAWGLFGAAFGPTILLTLFWRRFNFAGALAGILVGAAADIMWLVFLKQTGVYEILPGFVAGTVAAFAATMLTAPPSESVLKQFDESVAYVDPQG